MKRKHKFIFASVILGIAVCLLGAFYYHTRTITLTLGMFSGSNWDVPSADSYRIIDETIQEFEKKHPNVNVKYVSGLQKEEYAEWMSQQALKSNLPDVFMVRSEDFATFANVGVLENLNAYIRRDETFHIKDYFSPALETCKQENDFYALPYESVPTLMYVNKTLLEKEHIKIPSKNLTWDEFYDICEKVTKDTNKDGKLDQFGVYDFSWQQAVYSNGGTIFDKEGKNTTLANNKVYEAVEFTRKLEMLSLGERIVENDFDNGKVAFRPMRFSEYRTYKPYPWKIKKYSDFEWECIPMPAGPQGKNTSSLDTLMIGMSSASSHKALAWEFMKLLSYNKDTQEKLLEYSQGVPVIKEVLNSEKASDYLKEDGLVGKEPYITFFTNIMEEAIPIKKSKEYESVMTIADRDMETLVSNKEDIKIGVDTLQTKIEVYLRGTN